MVFIVIVNTINNEEDEYGDDDIEDVYGLPSDDNIPNCQYCGSKRLFEFQIMPQMSHCTQQENANTTNENKNSNL